MKKKQSVDAWLNEVDYRTMEREYVPSPFALTFMNFIKLVNGTEGESNKTPVFHLKMLDKLAGKEQYIVNLCFRGSAKTTLFMEYLSLYLGVFHHIPNFGSVDGMIYISDSMENGVKSARKNIEYRYNNSEFLQEWIPQATFTDAYIEFTNKKRERLGIKLFGAQTGLRGTKIFGKRPVLCHAKGTPVLTDQGYHLVEEYYKKGPSRFLKGITVSVDGMVHNEHVTPEHRYQVASLVRTVHKKYLPEGKTLSTTTEKWIQPRWVEAQNLAVRKPLGNQQTQSDYLVKKIDTIVEAIPPLKFYQNTISQRNAKGQIVCNASKAIYKQHPLLEYNEWWWLYGLYLADGHSATNRVGFTVANTQRNTVGKKLEDICALLGYKLSPKVTKNGCYQVTITDSVLDRMLRDNHLANSVKNLPNWVLRIDPEKQKQLLLGYIAGDGYIDYKRNQVRINSINQDVIIKLGLICERLGLPYHVRHTRKKDILTTFPDGKVYVSHQQKELRLSQNVQDVLGIPIKSLPSTEVFIQDGWIYRRVKKVTWDTGEKEYIPIQTPDHTYQTLFGMSHNCILDDLVSDDAANSRVQMQTIKDTVYKGVNYALDPNKRKVILNGTPFNKNDIIIEAVESGGWDVNVWPVCERFPCKKEEFAGAWPDRFGYEVIKDQYDMAIATGKTAAFQQELMLRISSEEERLVLDSDLRWYSRKQLLNHRNSFNFYITTDFAVSSKRTADYSAIAVWAYNSNGDWFWVDGMTERQTINKTIDQLFTFVSMYNPISVGIEVTGQQLAFITWLQEQMMTRNIWFNFASSGSQNSPGIRPTTDKFTRFSLVVPWFKAGKMFFPEEMKESVALGRMLEQLSLATINGLKGHDDCIDTISMLGYINAWKPSINIDSSQDNNFWQEENIIEEEGALASYIV